MKKEEKKVSDFRPPCESALKIEENPEKAALSPEKTDAPAESETAKAACESKAEASAEAAKQPAEPASGESKAETEMPAAEAAAEPAGASGMSKAADGAESPEPAAGISKVKSAAESTPGPAPLYAAPPKHKEPPATRLDAVFAGIWCVVAWLFWRMQNLLGLGEPWFHNTGRTQNIGIFLFVPIFAAAVLGWLYYSGRRPTKESWFWLGITAALGGAFALPYGGDLLGLVHYMALLAAASYWVLSASGRLVAGGKSSNYLFFDVIHMVLVLPWCNFGRIFAVPYVWLRQCREQRARQKKQGAKQNHSTLWAALGGIGVAVLLLMIVVPQLLSADAGFEALWNSTFSSIGAWFSHWFSAEWLESTFVQIFFTVPTAMFLYGLVYGCIHGRYLEQIDSLRDPQLGKGLRIVPRITANTALAVLCGVYAVFIAVQANYLFGAFFGTLPQGFSYAEYARHGFFELCRVAAVNLCILLGANGLCRTPRSENRALRRMNILLSALTLLLLTTAAAKMALYISAYGLTEKRVLVSVFLVWLAAVFAGVIVMQLRHVELVRFAVVLGAVLFTLLCLLPVGNGIEAYNEYFEKNEPAPAVRIVHSGDYT